MILLALTLTTAAAAAPVSLLPASEKAILSGVDACLLATGRAGGALPSGWHDAPAGRFNTDGRAIERDNVVMALAPSAGGACMIVAKGDAAFSGSLLRHDLEHRFGARLVSATPPVLRLPDGRLIRLNVGARNDGPTYVHLAIAGARSK